ncbi:MAG TPA: hypothetical protein EYP49_11145 [Anaerolineae bacterium]|nr:hypothetical protein [Anaerolineae bacterium]
MRTSSLLSIFFLIVVVFGARCTPQIGLSENRVFEFSSGGAYHPQGFGEWRISLDAAGVFSITHNIRGETKDYGVFTLTEKENSELWELVRAAGIEGLESSPRSGLPDEVKYTFVLRDGTQAHSVEIWVNDARENDEIVALVDRLATLIEAYTGQKPVLW